MTPEMGNEVERLKALTLDLLGANQRWMSYANIYWEHYEADGEVNEVALRDALVDLVLDDAIERDKDEYRWVPPQEAESLADKVKRLEAEREAVTAELERLQGMYDRLDAERLALPADAQRALEERDLLRAEQAADRAATRALVDVLPRCEHRDGCGSTATGGVWDALHYEDDAHLCDAHRVLEFEEAPYAAPLRALQALMATWPIDGKCPGAETARSEETARKGEAFREMARRCGDPGTSMLAIGTGSRDGFSFVMPEDGAVRTSFNSETGEATATYFSPRFDGERALPVSYPHRRPRYVGEFGDIDEPSVGDVEGYGVRR